MTVIQEQHITFSNKYTRYENLRKQRESKIPVQTLQQVIKTTQNIIGTRLQISVTSMKWDVCTEPKGL